ncbi:MAG: 30S ribosome-binding factor RbfA [Clostridia bacterium]|nr:30S ribosome-binding factor RbfA [Clostridia bacterium]
MASHRQDRIEEEVKKELSALIRELKDPRISGVVSVIAVDVTKDLRFAKAHISVLGSEEQKQDTIKGITAAAGFIRREIGHRVGLRHTPEFTFKLDSSIEYGAHINKIIEEVSASREEDNE